jgi:hypothetical protein
MDKEMINLLKKVQIFYAFFSKFSQKVKKVTKAEAEKRKRIFSIFAIAQLRTSARSSMFVLICELR